MINLIRSLSKRPRGQALSLLEQAMHRSGIEGNVNNVLAYIKRGANINSRCSGMTLLMFASSSGRLDMVTALLDAGANVDAQMSSTGDSALTLAARAGHSAVVKRLIDGKANLYATITEGLNVLILAAWGGHVDIVELVLAQGMHVDIATNGGTTALMMASRNGHIQVVHLLIEAGANVNTVNAYSRTALSYALKYRRTEVSEVLKKAGAIDVPSTRTGRVFNAAQSRLVLWLERRFLKRF